MPCLFQSCCWSSSNNNGDEPHKKSALLFVPSSPHHQFRHSSSRSRRSASAEQHSRGYIPWVWSRKFHETYQIGKILGEGSYAVVHEATKFEVDDDDNDEQPSSSSYAVKVLQRNRLNTDDLRHFKDEVLILLDLQPHDHIVQLHELYKTQHYFFVVMEKLEGGELFDRLCELEYYDERDARNVCRGIFEALAYCHDRKIAHRDLKPENLLLASSSRHFNDDDNRGVKIGDFGFAKRVARPKSLQTRCGSPAFTAPEIINWQPYDERVDNWSLGVIVFVILGGYNPFWQDTIHATYQLIRQVQYDFDPEYWDGISRDAKNLIRGLLNRDVEKRITAQQALQHPWMTGRGGDDLLKPNPAQNDGKGGINLQKQFKEFHRQQTERRRRREEEESVRSVSFYWLETRR